MKRVLICCLLTLAMAGGFAFAAAPAADKKPGNAGAQPNGKDDKNAATDDKKVQDEAAADKDDKPAAKKNNGKKSSGLKLTTADEAELLKTLSYMQGYELGKQIAQMSDLGIELDKQTLIAAFQDALDGKDPTMTEKERNDVTPQIQKLIEEKRTAKMRELSAKNKAEGKEFLAVNKKKEGVKTLPSGLQYKVLKSGKGETPKRTDTVKAHYKGTLLNGTEFDSSYRRGQPASFPVGRVIPGWTEALQLMKVGDKWQLFIPAELAYGEQSPPGSAIPPSATLIFDVELLGIEKGGRAMPALK